MRVPDWVDVETFVASRLHGLMWMSDADVKVRGKDLVVRVPASAVGVKQAQERLALVRGLGLGPVVGALGGTLGLSFVFMHAPEGSRVEAEGVTLKHWPVVARPNAWRQRTIWWKLPGAAELSGLLQALGKSPEAQP
jgi:hypothetical protein